MKHLFDHPAAICVSPKIHTKRDNFVQNAHPMFQNEGLIFPTRVFYPTNPTVLTSLMNLFQCVLRIHSIFNVSNWLVSMLPHLTHNIYVYTLLSCLKLSLEWNEFRLYCIHILRVCSDCLRNGVNKKRIHITYIYVCTYMYTVHTDDYHVYRDLRLVTGQLTRNS